MLGRSELSLGALSYADLFAGCGGLSLGLEWAGFQRAAAIEVSPDAALSYYHNLVCREEMAPFQWSTFLHSREVQVATGLIVGNIEERFDDFLDSCEKRSRSVVDLVVGGPPCQGYSTAGRRDPQDPRNTLGDYMVKAVANLRPKVVLVENVPAIKAPFNKVLSTGSPLQLLTAKLEAQGYKVSTLLLRASAVGVPQRRPRLFALGLHADLLGSLPARYQMTWYLKNGLAELIPKNRETPTVGAALGDLGDLGYRLRVKTEYGNNLAYARTLRFARQLAVPAALAVGERIGRGDVHNHELRKHRPDTTRSTTTTPRAPIRICTMPTRLASSPQSAQPMPKAANNMAHPIAKTTVS